MTPETRRALGAVIAELNRARSEAVKAKQVDESCGGPYLAAITRQQSRFHDGQVQVCDRMLKFVAGLDKPVLVEA